MIFFVSIKKNCRAFRINNRNKDSSFIANCTKNYVNISKHNQQYNLQILQQYD